MMQLRLRMKPQKFRIFLLLHLQQDKYSPGKLLHTYPMSKSAFAAGKEVARGGRERRWLSHMGKCSGKNIAKL